MSPFWCILAIGALFSASIAFQWAPLPKDGDVIYACKGDDVTFPWAYTLSPGEEISSIEWLFDGFSQEMIAMLSHGVFVPLPAFSGRVHQISNGGIVLSRVTTGDAGNYTVEVNVRSVDVFKHTVILQVNSGLPTSDGQLHVHQEPDAVLDSTTQQWSLVLSCGIFLYLAQPPFPVEMLTPSGHILASTNYKDGYFHLHLANPIEDGSYTCRVPEQHLASACLHGNHNATGQASVVVDRMEARITLMEAEVRSLRHDKLQLEQQVTVLQTQKADLNDLDRKVDTLQNNLTNKVDNLQNDLTQNVAIIQNNLTQQAVSFNNLLHQATGNLGNTLTNINQKVDNLQNDLTQNVAIIQNNLTQQAASFNNLLHQATGNLDNTLTNINHKVDNLQNDLTQNVAVLKNNLTQQAASFNYLLHQETVNLGNTINQKVSTIQNNLNQQTASISSLDQRMSQELGQLRTSITHMIHDAKTPLIGFNAQSTDAQQLSPPTHLKFNNVLYNAGQGYDSSTGDFTAPLSGAYFLIFHTRSYSSSFADSAMKVNGNRVCRAYINSNGDHGSCHAVVHMAKGDKAWVEPWSINMYYIFDSTSFAGFLFYADP